MPFDMSVQQVAIVVCAFLLGALIDAIIAGFLLVRAERRNKQLRRRIAQLTATTTAGGTQANDEQQPEVNTAEPQPAREAQPTREAPTPGNRAMPSVIPPREPHEPEHEQAPQQPSRPRPEPAPWVPEEDADALDEIPLRPSTIQETPRMPEPPPAPKYDGPDRMEKPMAQPESPRQDQEQNSPFATVDAAEKFQKDYRDPMEDARQRIAQLRSQINAVTNNDN